MALSVPERIAQCAEQIAADPQFGYSQPNRTGSGSKTISFSDGTTYRIKGGDLDCSEMVRRCVNAALGREAIPYLWTGNMPDVLPALGFARIPFSAGAVRRGDVLLVTGHTGVALGNGRQADAHGDELGGITGPTAGDNTGHEVEVRSLRTTWTAIYRHQGSTGGTTDTPEGAFPMSATVTLRGVNVRTAPSRKTGRIVARYSAGEQVTIDGLVLADGHVWGTYVGASGNRRYVALGTTEFVR